MASGHARPAHSLQATPVPYLIRHKESLTTVCVCLKLGIEGLQRWKFPSELNGHTDYLTYGRTLEWQLRSMTTLGKVTRARATTTSNALPTNPTKLMHVYASGRSKALNLPTGTLPPKIQPRHHAYIQQGTHPAPTAALIAIQSD